MRREGASYRDWGLGIGGRREGNFRGGPWRWGLGTVTRLGQDKRCGSATGPPGPLGPQAFKALCSPSSPAVQGPEAPTNTPWPGLINCLGPTCSLPRPVPQNPHSTSYIRTVQYAVCIVIGRRRTQPQHTQHMLCTTATASVTVYSWAVTDQDTGKQSPHLACSTPTRTQRRRRPSPCVLACLCFCVLLDSTAGLLAQLSLSSCQSVSLSISAQSHHDSCRPRGPQK